MHAVQAVSPYTSFAYPQNDPGPDGFGISRATLHKHNPVYNLKVPHIKKSIRHKTAVSIKQEIRTKVKVKVLPTTGH